MQLFCRGIARAEDCIPAIPRTPGDIVLRHIGKVLRSSLRTSDIPARVGGDEFSIILTNISKADVILTTERVLKAIEGIDQVEANAIQISASIGVAMFPSQGNDANNLIKKSDQAMYQAKKDSSQNIIFHK